MKRKNRLFILITACLALLGAVSCDTGGPKATPDPIAALLPAITPRAIGSPLGAKRFATMDKVVEYLILGSNYDGLQNTQVLVDPYKTFGKTSSDAIALPAGMTAPTKEILDKQVNNDIIASMKKAAKAGNFDDDTKDEVAMVSWSPASGKGSLTIINPSEAGVVTNDKPAGADLAIKNGASDANPEYDLAVADVDEDGYDEIIVVGSLVDDSKSSGQLWIFDDAVHSYSLVKKTELTGNSDVLTGNKGVKRARVVAGMGSDKKVKITVAWTDSSFVADGDAGTDGKISYGVFDGAGLVVRTDKSSRLIKLNGFPTSSNLPLFSLALADVDGDKVKELVIMGLVTMLPTVSLIGNNTDIISGYDASPTTLVTGFSSGGIQPLNKVYTYPEADGLVALDCDLDRKDELVIGNTLFDYDAGTLINPRIFTFGTIADIQAGDVNGDAKPDVILLMADGTVEAHGYLDQFTYPGGVKTAGTPLWTVLDTSGSAQAEVANAILVPMHADDDSVFIEYDAVNPKLPAADIQAAHTVGYSGVQIVALLAAPPTKDGIGQNNGNSGTALGTGKAESFAGGFTTSLRAGVIVGNEFAVSGGVFGVVELSRAEWELQVQLEYSGSYGWGVTTTQEVTDTAAAGEDLVIFTAVPYDVFTYTFASHPNPALVGTKMSIMIPQTPKLLSLTLDYYNKTTTGIKISKDLLQHTPYDLSSYPAKADVAKILAKTSVTLGDGTVAGTFITPFGPSMGPYPVGQGNGTKSAQVSVSNDFTMSQSITLSVDASAKAIAGGFKAGVTGGFSIGGFFDYSFSTSTTFCGTVGAIPGDTYAANQYNWGIFAYKQILCDPADMALGPLFAKPLQNFTVVNYWVE